ncbi:MAG TPA: thioredoxin domain-containing protein, partial [Bryobacteraceae bacterium]|nr:thioredoxin domain-containing protein [Bryobacteraceae bacterium]
KILTAWNGLAISAFAKAAAILREPRYEAAARRAADFILSALRAPDGSLLRRYRAGEAGIAGMLDDYAFFVQALLDLYEVTFDFAYLTHAINIAERQSALLEDRESGGFFASSQEDAMRLMRAKDDYDGAEPSGNSVALMNLLRLHRITGREDFNASARRLISAFADRVIKMPYAMPQMLCAWEYEAAEPREILIAGAPDPDMVREIWRRFDPNRILLRAGEEIARYRPEAAEMRGPAVYVCRNFVCNAPVNTVEDFAGLLE